MRWEKRGLETKERESNKKKEQRECKGSYGIERGGGASVADHGGGGVTNLNEG